MDMMLGYTADLVVRDAQAFVDYLHTLPEKKPGGVGTTGYCMGGRLSLITAANLGERDRCIRLLPRWEHRQGGRPRQPASQGGRHEGHRLRRWGDRGSVVPRRAERPPREGPDKAGVAHTIETYSAHHGFAVPDNASYDEAAAERHWKAMENLFGSVLTS